MGLFGQSKKKKEIAAQNLLTKLVAAEATNKGKSSTAGKMKLVTRQCKVCGFKVTSIVGDIPAAGTCHKRGGGKPHVWQVLGYEYR